MYHLKVGHCMQALADTGAASYAPNRKLQLQQAAYLDYTLLLANQYSDSDAAYSVRKFMLGSQVGTPCKFDAKWIMKVPPSFSTIQNVSVKL